MSSKKKTPAQGPMTKWLLQNPSSSKDKEQTDFDSNKNDNSQSSTLSFASGSNTDQNVHLDSKSKRYYIQIKIFSIQKVIGVNLLFRSPYF